jgi:predicted Zn-ribbon and HTH transcriptional regulator
MKAPALELGEIFRLHGPAYLTTFRDSLSHEQKKALRAIAVCRTAALGGHVEQCDQCGYRKISYCSCRNRHCPKCQGQARARWLEHRAAELLPVEYFHVVFTLPRLLAPLALQNQRLVYGILFRAAAETLLQIAADPRHLGARIGFLAVLHTWGQNLHHHPHLHCVVPGGGIASDQDRWISCRRQFLFPVKVPSRLFRAKFVAYLKTAFRAQELDFHGELKCLGEKRNFVQWLTRVAGTEWVVYAKPPFGGPRQVLKYLARYTHRVVISNQRLVSLENGRVTFRWKNYARASEPTTMTLTAEEFIRRLLLHVLPKGFVKVRHFGFLANRGRRDNVLLCRKLLAASSTGPPGLARHDSNSSDPDANTVARCPRCKVGSMKMVEILVPQADAIGQSIAISLRFFIWTRLDKDDSP